MENDYQNDDFIRYNSKKEKSEKRKLVAYFAVNIPIYILVLFFAVFFSWYLVFVNTHIFVAVAGPSMMPVLNNGITASQIEQGTAQDISYDAVYADRTTPPKVFDMVVFQRPTKIVIKRLMAQEGDYITIATAKNAAGQEVLRFYRIPAGQLEAFTENPQQTDQMAMIVEDGVQNASLGVNNWRLAEVDSVWTHTSENQQPLLQEKQVSVENSGTVTNRYEYNFCKKFLSSYGAENSPYTYFTSAQGLIYVQVPQGKFFCLGDNRAHSTDSRENGFVDVEQIIGRSEFVVYNFNFGNRILEVIKFYFREVEKFFAR